MKSFIVLALFVAVACAAPQGNPKDAVIVKNNLDNIGVDGYNLDVETSDGTKRQEQGELINAGTEDEALVIRGFYSYLGLDGVEYRVDFIADKNGFQPSGAHIPV